MNGSEHSAETSADARSIAHLTRQVRWLQTSLIATLLILVLLSTSVCLYLFRQVSLVRKELDACNLAVQEYQTKRGPFITNLVVRLQSYAQSNPDFIPILEKYGVAPPSFPATPVESRK